MRSKIERLSHNRIDALEPASNRCLILGASTRAAAESALRAGLQPVCGDYFADSDLQQIAEVLPTVTTAREWLPLTSQLPTMPLIYTGALENHPQIIEQIAGRHSLWGNGVSAIKRARDPFFIQQCLKDHGLPSLQVHPGHTIPADNSAWMIKPYNSAGGKEIAVWNEQQPLPDTKFYFQQRVEGILCSALFLASADRTILIGLSRQQEGCEWLNATRNCWCGNIAPVMQGEQELITQAAEIGQTLAEQCRLQGLFGIDLMLSTQLEKPGISEKPGFYVLEINPRYTASVELYERAFTIPLMLWHRWGCESFKSRQAGQHFMGAVTNWEQSIADAEKSGRVFGKAIYYAPEEIVLPPVPLNTLLPNLDLADIPPPGKTIQAGIPLCTIFSSDKGETECLMKLEKAASKLTHFLQP